MSAIWLLLVLLHLSQLFTAQTASLSSRADNALFTFPEATNLTTASHAGPSLLNPSNELSIFFTNPGGSIPAAELRHTLSIASADVLAYLPHSADSPIPESFFERNISFPETGDSVYVSVYAFGIGLSWLQLSHTLVILQGYVRGMGPGHPDTHYQQLEFYVQLAPGVEVAHGAVGIAPGAKAVAKRSLVTTTLELPHGNSSSLGALVLPIIFNIPKTNLDLNVTSLGAPIPEDTVLTTIEQAFTDVVINHTDIDALIPAGRAYTFNATSGKRHHEFETEIAIAAYPGEEISWGLVCILYYGLRDFMHESDHFNEMAFEFVDGRLGVIGHGAIFYRPVVETASTERLRRGQGSRGMRAAV